MHPDEAVAALGREKTGRESVLVPTGSAGLDVLIGGWPIGSVSEIYGPAFTAKTTLALEGVKNMQEYGTVAYVPMDGDFHPDYARRIGIDVDSLLVIRRPGTGAMWRELPVDFVVLDSVSYSKQVDHINYLLAGKTILAVSQVRTALSDPYRATTGGYLANASVRVQLAKHGDLIQANVSRNTLGWPGMVRSCCFQVGPDGIFHDGEVFDLALQTGLIETESGHYYRLGDHLGHGREAALRSAVSHPGGIPALEALLHDEFRKIYRSAV